MAAKNKLLKLLDTVAKEANYNNYNVQMKEISTDGGNFTSILYLITISAPGKQDLKLFAKVANIPENIRDETLLGASFKNESVFYEEIVETFRKIENINNVTHDHRFITPKLYASSLNNLEETMILEDLLSQGYTDYDRTKSITWEYSTKAVESLAKFHALSFSYSLEYPKKFNELRTLIRPPIGGEGFKNIFYNQLVTGNYNIVRVENRQKLRDYFEKRNHYEEFLAYYKPYTKGVICHGDYRISNLMHKYCVELEEGHKNSVIKRHNPIEDGLVRFVLTDTLVLDGNQDLKMELEEGHRNLDNKLQVIVVDYQTLHIGSPVFDLLFLIYSGSDADFRKMYYKKLLQYYYNQLNMSLQRLNLDIANVYPKDCYDTDLKAFKMYGLYMAMVYLPIITTDTDDIPEIAMDFHVTPSQLCRQRFNEIVDEYIAMGLI